ncbi:MAG: 4-hydroxythreonine-4-phosphate dehydrogenase PdxA [Candidatus Krumholzibacteria bacterium]|nr:4-hydroxythreonine-4-phosphate dehydrogenase PdxA [Candidatus Krumholzibacteria bacterium]
MSETDIRIALTIGDPAGIGPELAASLLEKGTPGVENLILIGSGKALREAMSAESASRIDFYPAEKLDGGWMPPSLPAVIDVAGDIEVPGGGPSEESGGIAGRAIELAARLAREGKIDGIVTGPISKEALRLAGYPWNGHTSMLADLLDAPDCQMVMVSGELRIVILTRDIPLKDVPGEVTRERIETGVRVMADALKELWGREDPVIVVASLNPHGGDGGVTGTEEIETVIPAIEGLRGKGLDVRGPVPADTLFYEWEKRGADAFIALYHDQGMIPFKIGGFEDGVNMTVGLPVVRTSVCHGTAYDIAGKGLASPGSLIAALTLAVECARTRQKQVKV